MRQPKQTLAVPYKIVDSKPQFAIFKRADFKIWQFISGGVEEGESSIEAVLREIKEETEMNVDKVFKLDSKATIPKEFVGGHEWADDLTVIHEFAFCFEVKDEIQLSHEHTEFKWVTYKEALELLKYDSNKTALWETNYRITNNLWR